MDSRSELLSICTPEQLEALPVCALTALCTRAARRVEPLWQRLEARSRRKLETALAASEDMARGTLSHLAARDIEGVDLGNWSTRRPDFAAWRTAAGVAIYALACACCSSSREAAVAAVLAWREALFAAAGDASGLEEAEEQVVRALSAPGDSPVRRLASAMEQDLEQLLELAKHDGSGSTVPPEILGPL